MFNGNTLLNTPLAIDKGYLMSLVPSLAAEFMLMKSSPIQSVKEREMQYLSKINKQGEGKENMKFPVIVDIVGAITKYSTYFSYGTQFLGELLKELDRSPSVSGIILNIDSGGGMVSGTAELTHIIKNL